MSKYIYNTSLLALERLDKRNTLFQKKMYKVWHKIYVWSFTKANGYSPYSVEAMDEHDRYTDNQEYNARMSVDGGDYA
jgi:single-stranded DNA-binding protein